MSRRTTKDLRIKGNMLCPDCGRVLDFELEYSGGIPTGTVPHLYNDGWKDAVFCEECSVEIFMVAKAERSFTALRKVVGP